MRPIRVSFHIKNLGVIDEPVNNGVGNGIVSKDLVKLSKRQISCGYAFYGRLEPGRNIFLCGSGASQRKIAFICAREFAGPDSIGPKLKKHFGRIYIGNEKFTFASAEEAVRNGEIDAVGFGKDFLSNPDLIIRYEIDAPLNPIYPETFYVRGSTGYTDYPFLSEGEN